MLFRSNVILNLLHSANTKVQGYSEVRELHITRFRRQDICGLKIAMYNLDKMVLA